MCKLRSLICKFYYFDYLGIISMILLTLSSEEIVGLLLERNHAFILKFIVRFHLSHVTGFIVFKLEVNINGFVFSLSRNARNPLKMGFLVIFTNPTSVLSTAILYFFVINCLFHPFNPHDIHNFSFILLLLINRQESNAINDSTKLLNRNGNFWVTQSFLRSASHKSFCYISSGLLQFRQYPRSKYCCWIDRDGL